MNALNYFIGRAWSRVRTGLRFWRAFAWQTHSSYPSPTCISNLQSAGCAAATTVKELLPHALRFRRTRHRRCVYRLSANRWLNLSIERRRKNRRCGEAHLTHSAHRRRAHSQGEPEEKILRNWISQLATMTPAEVASALESANAKPRHGECRRWCSAVDASQYDNTARSSEGQYESSQQVPAEDYVNGLRTSRGPSVSLAHRKPTAGG